MANDMLANFEIWRQSLLSHTRICGESIAHASVVPPGIPAEEFIKTFARQYGFCEPDTGEDEWKHGEADYGEAKSVLVELLRGGSPIGHSRDDIPEPIATALVHEFLSFFDPGTARFFVPRDTGGHAQMLGPSNDPHHDTFIFNGGCIALDDKLVGLLWVFDND